MRLMVLALVLGLITAPACDSPVEPDVENDGLSVYMTDGQLTLRNTTASTIHYVAVEEEASALIDLHFDPTEWPSIRVGQAITLEYGEVLGYSPGDSHVRVYWWSAGEYGEYFIFELR